MKQWPDAMILIFWMLSFKPTISLSFFTFIKRLFSSSLFSAIRTVQFSSVRSLTLVQLFATSWAVVLQASLSITNSRSLLKLIPLNWWCHPTISSAVVPFSSHLQSFPASRSFPKSQIFTSGGQSIGVSASSSVLLMNIQDWFPLGWTGWTSLLSKGLSRVFSNTTVQKHHSRVIIWIF